MMKPEFRCGDLIHKPHKDYKHVFVPMRIQEVKVDYKGRIEYSCESIDRRFAWITITRPEFILESKHFGKVEGIIDEEYQKWIKVLSRGKKGVN